MKKRSVVKGCALVLLCWMLLAMAFYFVAGEQMHFRDEYTASLSPAMPLGELTAGTELRQRFTAEGDELLWLELLLSDYGRENAGCLRVSVADAAGTELAAAALDAAAVKNDTMFSVLFPAGIPLRPGETYTLIVTALEGEPGSAVTAWYGNAVASARGQAAVEIPPEERVELNGQVQPGKLVFTLRERSFLRFGTLYWPLAWAVGGILLLLTAVVICRENRGYGTLVFRVADAFRRYGFLLRQLIARDFKTKYKRSVLGIFWSFLNPLLTMLVQYLVFSTLFRSDVRNFPLYLLSGIVCFSFFNEAVGMSLMSIVGNASLITKVYVPKYIYPVSRVLSSGINLLLSLIPLFLVALLTGTPLRWSALLLPFPLLCLVAFCIGMGMLLSTAMVFFRDTQFLWGVVSMLWMYLTPIFYPESIIPGWLLPIFKCNPLYHVIRFVRIVLMDGMSPEPKAYGLCLVACLVPLVIGAAVFRKNQDKFILHL